MKLHLLAFPLAAIVSGCAYFNGLYNANQLAGEAERAEREGRPGEARSLWVQAAVKAESVAVRYPNSKYRDDALLMQGRALRRSGGCLDATTPLERAVASSAEDAIWTEAGLLLAECLLALGEVDSAWIVLFPLVHHWDSSVVHRAWWLRGRAALARGDVSAAVDALGRTDVPGARIDFAAALVAAGRVSEAAAQLDSARQREFDESQWASILDAVGRRHPEVASTLVDSLVEDGELTQGQRARLLLDDAERWHQLNAARRRDRLDRAAQVAGDSIERRVAEARLLESLLHEAMPVDSLAAVRADLERLAAEGGEVASETRQLRRVLSRGLSEFEYDGRADVQLFRFAEEVRDSLGLDRLSAALFVAIADRHPESPFAPKALLAAAMAWEEGRAVAIQRLTRSYGDSPYALAAGGRPAPGFEALEDSLRTVLLRSAVLPSGSRPPSPVPGFSPDTSGAGE
jgi:hypothetical protein